MDQSSCEGYPSLFDASRLRIFDADKVRNITLDQQSQLIASRILPHLTDLLADVPDDPLVLVQRAVRNCLPRLQAGGWSEESYIDTFCIWEIKYGPNFERAPEFVRVPRFYVRAHETQHEVFADMMITLRAAEVA